MSDWDRKVCPKCDWGHYGKKDVCDPCLKKQSSKSELVLTFDSDDEKEYFIDHINSSKFNVSIVGSSFIVKDIKQLKVSRNDDLQPCYLEDYSTDADEDLN